MKRHRCLIASPYSRTCCLLLTHWCRCLCLGQVDLANEKVARAQTPQSVRTRAILNKSVVCTRVYAVVSPEALDTSRFAPVRPVQRHRACP